MFCNCGTSLMYAEPGIKECWACRNIWSDKTATPIKSPDDAGKDAKPIGRPIKVGDRLRRYRMNHIDFDIRVVESITRDYFGTSHGTPSWDYILKRPDWTYYTHEDGTPIAKPKGL